MPARDARPLAAVATAIGLLAAAPAAAAGALRPVASAREDYSETFTFIGDFDNGAYVQLQLAVTNLGPGTNTGICRALLLRPGARAWTASQRVKQGRWNYRADLDQERLEVGPCTATSGPDAVVRAELSGTAITLRFPGPLAPRDPPSSRLKVGDGAHQTWILQAFTAVRAEVSAGGAPAESWTGGGYADHSRSLAAPRGLARGWVRFRALRGPTRVLLLQRLAPDGSSDPNWLWREGGAFQRLDRLATVRAGSRAEPRWTVEFSGGAVVGSIRSDALLFRHAPVEELGALSWAVRPLVGSPVTYTHRATLRLGDEAPIEGLMEVSLFED